MSGLRGLLLVAHRWVGLTIAAFLVMAGLTGAVISWDDDCDELLNAHLISAPANAAPAAVAVVNAPSAVELARRHEAANPGGRVTYLPLAPEPGKTLAMFVEPRVDPKTGQLPELGYNQVFVDMASGREMGRREWGKPALTRENFVPFLYMLHYSLHIPAMFGIDRWGVWLMGGIALLWTLDCFVGFYLTLPGRGAGWLGRWKPAWRVKWSGRARRINFDLHRAAGLWLWAFLFVLAVSAVSLNLYSEVAQPIVSAVSDFTPSPYDLRTPRALDKPIEPRVSFESVIAAATREAKRRGWTAPAGAVSYAQLYGVHAVMFFEPGGDHGVGGMGPPALYFDAEDGRYLGDYLPWKGTGGDLFLQLQFPIHSGRIAGLPGRIFISFIGLVVALLLDHRGGDLVAEAQRPADGRVEAAHRRRGHNGQEERSRVGKARRVR